MVGGSFQSQDGEKDLRFHWTALIKSLPSNRSAPLSWLRVHRPSDSVFLLRAGDRDWSLFNSPLPFIIYNGPYYWVKSNTSSVLIHNNCLCYLNNIGFLVFFSLYSFRTRLGKVCSPDFKACHPCWGCFCGFMCGCGWCTKNPSKIYFSSKLNRI